MITAEVDPLLDEAEAYGERLRAVGVATTVTRYDGMFHGFLWYADFIDDARVALDEAGAALARAFARASPTAARIAAASRRRTTSTRQAAA